MVLFLGGLLALGFFFGGQAHAAEPKVPALPEAGLTKVQPVREVRHLVQPVTDTVREVAKPVRQLTDGITAALPVPVPVPVPQEKPPVVTSVTPAPQSTPQSPKRTAAKVNTPVRTADPVAPRPDVRPVTYRHGPVDAAPQQHHGQLRTPVRHLPVDPCGTDGKWSADGHTPRAGEPHAVPVSGGTRFVLAPAAGRPDTDEPVCDRPHDILEFPG